MFGIDAHYQSESGTGDRSGGWSSSRGRLSIGRGVRHRSVHGKKFVFHTGVFHQIYFRYPLFVILNS